MSAMILFLLLCANTEKQTIPLSEVWAYEMPGTRDIQELGKEGTRSKGLALVAKIGEAAIQRVEESRRVDIPRPGFAVAGVGLPALRAAHSVLAEGKKPRSVFSPDDEITLLFFSEPAAGSKVHIGGVERRKGLVIIRYRLERYYELNLTGAFALVPLGKLPVGEYDVKMEPLPSEKASDKSSKKWIDQFLCKPFSFRVIEK
jgi:hypothetical protein